jgi:uncharacterized OB-fold protein
MSQPVQRGFAPVHADADSAGWWRSVAERRFTLPRCLECRAWFFPPASSCPSCGSRDTELTAASGDGRVYSWVVVNRALDPAFAIDTPYTVAAIDLGEGPRMFGRLTGDGPVHAGDSVRAVFYEVEGQVLVGFAPAMGRRLEDPQGALGV